MSMSWRLWRKRGSNGRQYEKQNRFEFTDLFPHIGDGMIARWQAEQRDDEGRVDNPARMSELKLDGQRILGGFGEIPGEMMG
jgi:hypothetical protein